MATLGEQISGEFTRIESARNTIRNKLIELGKADSTANLTDCATAVGGIDNRGAVNVSVQEGESYTIPAGYHNGSGTVKGVAGGGNYTLQAKTTTPTKKQQSITPDAGYYGLSAVTVGAIPEAYQDVTSTTAAAGDVLSAKVFVAKDGTVTTGTMTNNGAVAKVLDTATKTYTVPKGYHSGTGTVSISTETKSATPTKSAQTISASTGKVISSVTVAAIPAEYITTDDATAGAGDILDGQTAYVDGAKVEGTMANNGAVSKTLDTATTSYTVPAGYHSGAGKVSIAVETKSATPTKSTQTIKPTSGKVLSQVTVAAIPTAYQDVSATTATADMVISGLKFTNTAGTVVTGTMANNGATGGSIDGLTSTSYTIPAGYTTGGTVSLTDDILEALQAI